MRKYDDASNGRDMIPIYHEMIGVLQRKYADGEIVRCEYEVRVKSILRRIDTIRNQPEPLGACEACGAACRPGDDHVYDERGEVYACYDCNEITQEQIRAEFGHFKAV